MWTIIIALGVGMVCGRLLRRRPAWVAWADRAARAAVYLLLLVLGLSVGANTAVVTSLPTLGFYALWLSLGGVAGSLLLMLPLSHWGFRDRNDHEG